MDARLDTRSHRKSTARRSLVRWAIGALAAAALLVPASAGAAVQAKPADAFVNSIGVATHTSFSDTVYDSRFNELKAKLAALGVRHIREDLLPSRSDQYQRLNQLASIGIGSTLIMGSPKNGTTGLDNLLSVVKNNLTGVDALEGPNEYYLSGDPNWANRVTEYQQHLYTTAKADPKLAGLPVYGPSTVFWQDGELGDISQWLDAGTIHPYPGGYPAEDYLGRHIDFAAKSSGSKPVVATETGYHNALNWTDSHPPVSEQTSATYMPRIFLESFRRGVIRTFTYELVDQWSNPSRDDAESNFGLLRNDLSEKPAFTALRNTISILSDPGTSFAPGSLDYTLGGNQEKLRQVLLQKRDGSFYLALWRTSSVWDPNSKVALNPASPSVSLSFSQSVDTVERYAPNTSAAPLASFSQPSSPLSIEVGPKVVVLKVTPSAAAPPPAPTPEQVPAPEPAPAPTPGPAPAPAPEPAPAPTPVPTPAPETTEPAPTTGGSKHKRPRKSSTRRTRRTFPARTSKRHATGLASRSVGH